MPKGFTFISHLFLSGYTKKALTSNLIVFLVNLNLIGFAYILSNIIHFFLFVGYERWRLLTDGSSLKALPLGLAIIIYMRTSNADTVFDIKTISFYVK